MSGIRPRTVAAHFCFAATGALAHTNEHGIDPKNFDDAVDKNPGAVAITRKIGDLYASAMDEASIAARRLRAGSALLPVFRAATFPNSRAHSRALLLSRWRERPPSAS